MRTTVFRTVWVFLATLALVWTGVRAVQVHAKGTVTHAADSGIFAAPPAQVSPRRAVRALEPRPARADAAARIAQARELAVDRSAELQALYRFTVEPGPTALAARAATDGSAARQENAASR